MARAWATGLAGGRGEAVRARGEALPYIREVFRMRGEAGRTHSEHPTYRSKTTFSARAPSAASAPFTPSMNAGGPQT